MIKVTSGNYEMKFTFRHTRDCGFRVKPGKVVTDITSCLLEVNGVTFDAMALCLEGDKFNKEEGRKRSLQRALIASSIPKEARTAAWDAYFIRS